MTDKANHDPELVETARALWPIEYKILGRTAIEDIFNGRPESDFVHAAGPRMIDFDTVLKVAIQVFAFLTAVVTWRTQALLARERGSSKEAVAKQTRKELKRLDEQFQSLAPEKRLAAYKRLLGEISDEDEE